MTDTDKLISDLAKDLKPVKPLPRAGLRAIVWSALTLAAVMLSICVFTKGFRDDIGGVLHNHVLCSETLVIFMAGLLSAFAAFRLCVPDTRVREGVRALIALPTLMWLALIGGNAGKSGLAPPEAAGEPCLTDLSFFMAIPLLAVVFMVMRAASVFPALAGYCAVLAAGSFGALGLRLLCPHDGPAHLLAWHFLPVMIFALCGLPLGKILLKANFSKKITR